MTIRVEAAVFVRVADPIKAVVAIRDYRHGVLRIAQTTLRADPVNVWLATLILAVGLDLARPGAGPRT